MVDFGAQYAGRRALITGGLGFIGSNLAKRLVDLGSDVTIVDSMIPEYGGNLQNIAEFRDKVQVNISDVRDEHSMHYLVQGQDYLFNLAGQTSHMDSMTNPYTDLNINCVAQLSILESCRKQNPEVRVVFASTRQIYGKPDYLPVDEKHPLRPVDVNGINKMAGEWYHILYSNVYQLSTCVLRLTNTIGPRMRIKDARQTFLGIWVKLLLTNTPFEVWGGDQLRDFTYVDDAVDALLMAACDDRAVGRIFNLGGSPIISLKELAELLTEVNGDGEFTVKPFPADRKRIDIGDYYGDFSLIRDSIGWMPKTDLRDALAATISYYRKNLPHYL
ncbi:MAG: NAD-dependent epimerase/dehydratase family protein [Gemmataceae bacterium]